MMCISVYALCFIGIDFRLYSDYIDYKKIKWLQMRFNKKSNQWMEHHTHTICHLNVSTNYHPRYCL